MNRFRTGVDIVENDRIATALDRFGDRFVNRIYLPGEIGYCRSMSNPIPHFAARFAAKEAISKALGTGIGTRLGWHDMEIVREESGRPVVHLHGRGESLARELGLTQLEISLSHTRHHAVGHAIAVLSHTGLTADRQGTAHNLAGSSSPAEQGTSGRVIP